MPAERSAAIGALLIFLRGHPRAPPTTTDALALTPAAGALRARPGLRPVARHPPVARLLHYRMFARPRRARDADADLEPL